MRPSIILSLLALIAVSGWSCEKRRAACVYELPAGFKGWAVVEYRRAECPPVLLANGRRVFRFDLAGSSCTSSAPEFGSARDEYLYVGLQREELPVTGWGKGGKIWAGSMGSCGPTHGSWRHYEMFFVGTEREYRDNASAQPKFCAS